MVKISALPPQNSPDGLDPLPATDTSVGDTKKLTLTKLKEWLQSLTTWITATMIAVGAITPEKLLSGAGTTWPWQAWTPTWTNLTVGNGTLDAKYAQIGKTVHFRLKLTFGSTTSIGGSVDLTAPTNYNAGYNLRHQMGMLSIEDNGTASYYGFVRTRDVLSTNRLQLGVYRVDATYASINSLSSTVPMTWTTSDQLMLVGSYEMD